MHDYEGNMRLLLAQYLYEATPVKKNPKNNNNNNSNNNKSTNRISKLSSFRSNKEISFKLRN